jgi:hypothetical protein
MLHALLFHTPVYSGEKQVGKLKHIIVDNDVANQVTVDPGLFGIERVVPINDIGKATPEEIQLDVTDDAWKAYAAFEFDRTPPQPNEADPDLAALTPWLTVTGGIVDPNRPANVSGAIGPQRTITTGAIVLSEHTVVEDERERQYQLRGLLVDAGRPLQLLLEDGLELPFEAVRLLDAERIQVQGSDPRAGTEV